jgi:hypothetical protein
MLPPAPRNPEPRSVELRVFVADRDDNPADLTRVSGTLHVVPKSAPPMKKALQLMMPDPPPLVPTAELRPLGDGHSIRVVLAEGSGAFGAEGPPGDGPGSVYLKVDLDAELARKGSSATVHLDFPSGKQTIEIGWLFVK